MAKGKLSSLNMRLAALTTDSADYYGVYSERALAISEWARYYSALEYYDSAAAILAFYSRYQEAFPFALAAGKWSTAASLVSSMPGSSDEDLQYKNLCTYALTLDSNGQTWTDTGGTSIMDSIRAYARYNSVSGYNALNILGIVNQEDVSWPVPLLDTPSAAPRPGGSTANNETIGAVSARAKNTGWLIYPNPTSGNFTVSAPEAGIMTVSNILGQEIGRYNISKGLNQVRLPEGAAGGIYTARISDRSGTVTDIAKLMYQP